MSEKFEIIEKEYPILKIGKKNKNHRAYTETVVNPWVENSLNKSENVNEGYDLEYAIDEDDEERDIYKEFTLGVLSCGVVNRLRVDENNILYGTARFKLPSACDGLTKKIYEGSNETEEVEGEAIDFLDTLAIVPKGKGSVKNQTVQDDFELYGFNLILKEDSSFEFEKENEEEKVDAGA
jgi:hypothetical protein